MATVESLFRERPAGCNGKPPCNRPDVSVQTSAVNAADFDLHGIVGIRVVGGRPADVAAVARQLGPIRRQLTRPPDITIRFVDSLRDDQPLHYLGLGEAAFTGDGFFILRGKHKSRVRARIPFAEIGGRCEIVCESGLPAVPLLIAIVNLTALSRGYVPLHAAAFIYQGRGVVTTGWSKGGKTETLLAFMARGATYVGDEWIYLSPDGGEVFGIPEPITVWDWHLRQMPEVRAQVCWRQRTRLRAVGAAVRLLGALQSNRGMRKLIPARLVDGLLPLLRRQLCVNVDPSRAFGERGQTRSAPFDALFFVASHESPGTLAGEMPGRSIAERMVHSLHEERAGFLSYYTQFRFAFPDYDNPFIERAADIERQALRRIFETKPAFFAFHPYPMSIPGLFDAMAPLLTEIPHENPDYTTD